MISANRKQLSFSHNQPKEREPTDLCTETKPPGLTGEPIDASLHKRVRMGRQRGRSKGFQGKIERKKRFQINGETHDHPKKACMGMGLQNVGKALLSLED